MIPPSRPRAPSGGALLAPRDTLASRLPELRTALEIQRDFRRAQLSELNNELSARFRKDDGQIPHGGAVSGAPSHALRQVTQQVAAGAFHALVDIEQALSRMRSGDYGRCCACDGNISLAVLIAIPQTTLCLTCRRVIKGQDEPSGLGQADPHERPQPSRGEHRRTVPPRAAMPWKSRRRLQAVRREI